MEVELCFSVYLNSPGKRVMLPPLPPLRTVRESFPSYGSSPDKPFLRAGISALAIHFAD